MSVVVPLCVQCSNPIEIQDLCVEALSKVWHPQCFKCTKCHRDLKGGKFHECFETNLPLCPECFKQYCDQHSPAQPRRGSKSVSPLPPPNRNRLSGSYGENNKAPSVSPRSSTGSHGSSGGVVTTTVPRQCYKCGEVCKKNDSWTVQDAALCKRRYHRVCLQCDGCGDKMTDASNPPVDQEGLHLCHLCADHLRPDHQCDDACKRATTCCIER
eukprot:PhF_6_TR9500/c0_g1_i2/m.14811